MALETATSSPTASAPVENRRRALRRPHVCEAWVRSPTDVDESRIEVTALDLSRHGVGFEAHEPLAEGCFYWIEIGFGDQRIAQEVRVRSCVESDATPGVFRVGAEFC
jgi:hypothetical protein